MRVNGAIGGSTNAVIHLLAIAGRVGLPLTLDDWDAAGRDIPTIVDLMPSGRFLMEEFFYAGGLPVVIRALGEAGKLHRDALTVSGGPIWDEVKDVVNWNEEVIRPLDRALTSHGGHRGAARQPRPGRRGAEAVRGHAAPDDAPRPRGRVRGHRRLQGAHRGRGARHRRDLRDGAEELRPARLSRHGRGRQHGRCRRRCCGAASPTWCGSPTRACRAPPTARWCSTSRPRPRAAGRWRSSRPAT